MVALMILGIMMLGTGAFFAHAMNLIENARSSRVALEAASARIDEALTAAYDTVRDANETTTVGEWPATIACAITERSAGTPVYRYKEITVTVTWSKRGADHTVSLTGIVGRR